MCSGYLPLLLRAWHVVIHSSNPLGIRKEQNKLIIYFIELKIKMFQVYLKEKGKEQIVFAM